MKKLLLLFLIAMPGFLFAQNVGIGTTTPSEKLHIKNASRNTVKISSAGFSDTTELVLSNRDNLNQGTDFSFKSMREEGLYLSSLSDLAGNTAANSIVVRPNGNVGIGLIPTSKLHIDGPVKLEGLNLFEFGAGVAGKEVNAGKIGYNAFGQSALTFVGAGTSASNRAFYFYGEGGTTFSGPVTITGNTNITGQMRLNGNAGTTGQVLTSNGASDPTWQNMSLDNDIRFAVAFDKSLSSANDFARITATRYNLNPSEIVISATQVTLNHSGLYHFDIFTKAGYFFASPPSLPPVFSIDFYNGLPNPFALVDDKVMTTYASTSYRLSEKVSLDVYVTAPANIRLFHNFGLGGGTSYEVSGYITGHLISD